MPSRRTYRVTASHDIKRLDRFLRDLAPDLSRGDMFAALRKGKITVNGRRVRDGSHRVAIDDRVEIPEPVARDGSRASIRSSNVELHVLYEDDRILVVDKPRGMVMHPGGGTGGGRTDGGRTDGGRTDGGTVLDALAAYADTRGKANRGFTPYLVHRLDRFTSGVLVTAKDAETAGMFGSLFKKQRSGEILKRYTTLVFGSGRDTDRILDPVRGKEALTTYSTVDRFSRDGIEFSLLDVEISTGRMHQIRIHLASRNLPVVGDDAYGDWAANKAFRRAFGIKEYLLHCREMSLTDPRNGLHLVFRAPLESGFARVLEALEAYRLSTGDR